jgi:CDP-diacylglycerol---serine O-phosphatidyltransferase
LRKNKKQNNLLLSAFILNKIKRNIPNAITCGNLLCGCLAILLSFQHELVSASYFIGIATILDFLDGFFARILKVQSPIGKQLDSLADCVTFGIAPSFIMFQLFFSAIILKEMGGGKETTTYLFDFPLICFISFIIPVFSIIRLAKFNIDTRQTNSFIGLPTPANAIFICSLPLIANFNNIFNKGGFHDYNGARPTFIQEIIFNPSVLVFICIVTSFLLIAELPLFALKFKSFGWKGNEIRFTFLLLSLLLLITLHFVGIPLIIVLYIIMSVVNNLLNKNKKGSR